MKMRVLPAPGTTVDGRSRVRSEGVLTVRAAAARRRTFQHADRGGADGDDPAARGFGFVDGTRSFLAQLVTLLMHGVGGDGFGFHRRESAQTDVQRQKANLHTARGDFGEQRFGEMQSGGRGCDRAGGLGKGGLVSLTVLLPSGQRPGG